MASDTKKKSAVAFRTISEASEELDVPQHVLRFWETKFAQIRPLKRGGRRRYYRPEDLRLLRTIRDLLYDKGYTIKGVQRLLKEGALSGGLGADVAEQRDHDDEAPHPILATPKVQDAVPQQSKPLHQSESHYSPFSRDDVIAAHQYPDAIVFNPSRSAVQTAIEDLRTLKGDIDHLLKSS